MTLVLRVWSRQCENTTEYQDHIQWTLKAVKDREQRVKEVGVDGAWREKVERKEKMREKEAKEAARV